MQITYRQLVAIAAAIAGLAFIGTGVRSGEVLFSVVGGAILVVAALALVDRWWAQVPALIVGVAGVAHAPIFVPLLEYPESTNDFAPAVVGIFVGAAVVGLSVTDLVGRKRGTGTVVSPVVVRAFGTGVAAVVVAISASVVMSATRETSKVDASEREGALVVTYEGAAIKEKSLTVKAGETARIVVDNEDAFVHDFVLEGTDVRFGLGPNDEKSAEFVISERGEYTYKCTITGHGSMKGTLVVE
jgi:plastocyanin